MSQIYFHADRTGALQHIDEIQTIAPAPPPDMLMEEYEGGLTQHGQQYLHSPKKRDSEVEWVFELVRLWQYDTLPSRFQSVFAFETIEEAQRFLSKPSTHIPEDIEPEIWKVEADEPCFKADMNQLPGGVPALVGAVEMARRYWEQESTDDPLWELFLNPPVKVLEPID